MYVVRVCLSCTGKLGLFKTANSGSTTKTLEPVFLSFLLAVSIVFLFLRGKALRRITFWCDAEGGLTKKIRRGGRG